MNALFRMLSLIKTHFLKLFEMLHYNKNNLLLVLITKNHSCRSQTVFGGNKRIV
jgi:hypothetical protein